MGEVPVELLAVEGLADDVASVVSDVRSELRVLAPEADVEHVGATSMPDGVTKGDVDVNLRVHPDRFDDVVAALSTQFAVAQPQNWTATFASFAGTCRGFPLGIQVTIKGSDDDFLVPLRDRLRADAGLRHQYDELKRASAPAGRNVYWHAKDDFLRRTRNR